MKNFGLSCLLSLSICVSGASWAGESCNALLQAGIYNINNTSNAVDSRTMAMSTFCQADYSKIDKSSSQAAAISGSYGPVSGGASGSASESQITETQRNICTSGFNSSAYSSQASSYSQAIYQGALDAWNKCQALSSFGVNFDMQPDPTMQGVTVTISANSGSTYQFQGLIQTGTGRSTCQTTLPARTGSLSGQVITVDASTSFPFSASNKLTVACSRNMVNDGRGGLSADAQRLIFNTSAGPYQVDLARVGSLSRISADDVISQARAAAKVDTQAAITAASSSISSSLSALQQQNKTGPNCGRYTAQSVTANCGPVSVEVPVPVQGFIVTGGGCETSNHHRPVTTSRPGGAGWICATSDIDVCNSGYVIGTVIACQSHIYQ